MCRTSLYGLHSRDLHYVTEAPSGRLRALGDHAPFMPIEEAVRDFVTHHLSQPDPYLLRFALERQG
jgi:hypothetical protein